MTCTGKTLGSLLDTYEARPDDVLKTLEAPQKPEGGIAVLRGNLAPRGAVVKQSGVRESMYRFTGKIWGGGDGTRVFFCRLRLRGCVTKQND